MCTDQIRSQNKILEKLFDSFQNKTLESFQKLEIRVETQIRNLSQTIESESKVGQFEKEIAELKSQIHLLQNRTINCSSTEQTNVVFSIYLFAKRTWYSV